MSDARVRIYQGHSPESNIIGLSARASGAQNDPRFADFMQDRGYKWHELDEEDRSLRPKGSMSYDHIEIRPPISGDHLREFAALVLGGVSKGKYESGIVDPGHNQVWVIDNRTILPDGPLGGGEYVDPPRTKPQLGGAI